MRSQITVWLSELSEQMVLKLFQSSYYFGKNIALDGFDRFRLWGNLGDLALFYSHFEFLNMKQKRSAVICTGR